MAGDSTRIVIAQIARVWLGKVGSLAPVDASTALGTDWYDVGYFTPDSLGWSTDPSFEEVRSHQSNFATRRFQTEDSAAMEVDLQEWSANNYAAVYGGGTVTTIGTTPNLTYKYVPPSIGARKQVACIIELIDGAKRYRRIIPRAEQTEGVEQSFERASESTLPLRLSVVGSDVGDPWYDLISNADPAFASITMYGV